MQGIVRNKKELIKLLKMVAILFTIGGVFGFIYEEIFYRIDLGYWVKRGSTFGPWITIYGFGTVFIFLATYYFRKNPFMVFVISCLISGVLEYATGFVLDKVFNLRLWDYNVEIWNWGNINGYVCARSILFFGVAGMMLMYMVYPIIKKISDKMNSKLYSMVCFIPACIFLIDIIVNLIV